MRALVRSFAVTLLAASALQWAPSVLAAEEYNGVFSRSSRPASSAADRIIVQRKRSAATLAWRQKLSTELGVAVTAGQSIGPALEVLQLQRALEGNDLQEALERIESDPDVLYAAPDIRRHAHALTNDPLLTTQWYLLGDQPSATRTDQAWDITTGSSAIVVAVLDTGVRFEHPDLGRVESGGKVLAGYDFISRVIVANDGDGRDADPSDPGDWISTQDLAQPELSNCETSDSSWHGTRVSGLIAGSTNNAIGVAGAGWNTRVLPVRVLGKCGGFDSDIIAGMRWAAGLDVPGVPTNPTPANVINMSLGGDGICTQAYQSAVDEITSRGILVVASAGNEGGPVSVPANCAGVLGVAGIRHIGTKVGFSNLGTEVSIAAPGGNCVNTGFGQPCLFSIVVASDSGDTAPLAPNFTDQLNYNVGTSFSAPQAASSVALMRSINSQLTPAQLITLLKQTATTFPVSGDSSIPTCHVPIGATDLQASECNCTTRTCGAGMLNTAAAVAAAQRPFAILRRDGTVATNTTISIDGSQSFAANGRSVASYQWSIENLSGAAPTIIAPTQASTTLQIGAATQFTLRLTVTDDTGAQDIEDAALATPAPPPPPTPPPPSSGGGGGGGTMGSEMLVLASLLARWRRALRRTSRAANV
ncbi:serine protease [Povalibacter uvarum]|uniref:Serine protease n=1 Tax=Povalibacter uvarum TaxID=732238 RepID=A0A841HGC1_9GAMM|nr:S8 family peptidase [Povalibacter uvarum]MBB6091947.1 serine protease [Povalibacter uvarum]